MKIINSKFISNNVNSFAACIYSYKSSVNVGSSEFKDNKGNQTGCIHT